MNPNNWKSGASCERTCAAFEACAVLFSGSAKRKSWAQATRRRYMGKYINWILWLKEKACWQVNKVYWKQGDHVEMCSFFKLMTINSTDRVRMIVDTSSHSYKVYYVAHYAANT